MTSHTSRGSCGTLILTDRRAVKELGALSPLVQLGEEDKEGEEDGDVEEGLRENASVGSGRW